MDDDLKTLMLRCVDAVADNNSEEVNRLFAQVHQFSLSGISPSPMKRMAAYFMEALAEQVVNSDPPIQDRNKITRALKTYRSISPFMNFLSIETNITINNVLEMDTHIHIVDLDIRDHYQWGQLFTLLCDRPTKIQSVKITGIGSSLALLEAIGQKLYDCAASMGLPFTFQPLEGDPGNLTLSNFVQLYGNPDEVIVVNLAHHCPYNVNGSNLETLTALEVLNPKLVTIVEANLDFFNGSLDGKFVGALHYYSKLFSALGEELPWYDVDRYEVEYELYRLEIRTILSTKLRGRKIKIWTDELRRAGFAPIQLRTHSSETLLGDLFPYFSARGYSLRTKDAFLSLCWDDKYVLTASAWRPSPRLSLPPPIPPNSSSEGSESVNS